MHIKCETTFAQGVSRAHGSVRGHARASVRGSRCAPLAVDEEAGLARPTGESNPAASDGIGGGIPIEGHITMLLAALQTAVRVHFAAPPSVVRAGATACTLVQDRMSHGQGSSPISSSHPSAPPAQWSGALERRRRVTCARGRATSRRGGHGSIPDGLSQSAPRLGPSGSGAGGRRRARGHSHQRSVPALPRPAAALPAPRSVGM